MLQANGFTVDTQFVLYHQNKKHYIYDIKVGNKIIEYHGDFWHSNPKLYNENFINPRTRISAKDKWALDQDKVNAAIDQGFCVLIIWESDFKQNKDEVIQKCIQFLTQ